MQGMIGKTEADYEIEIAQLRRENQRLQEEVLQLKEDLASAIRQIEELQQKKSPPPSFVKPNKPKGETKRARKKRAREHNTSRKRMEPTQIERHALERCPTCHYELSGKSIDYRREVIELPPPQALVVTEHQVIKRWCPHCEKWHSPTLDLSGKVIGQGRIGVGIASLVAYLRTRLRMPVRLVREYLQTQYQLKLSEGEIVELEHAVRRKLKPQLDALLGEVRASAVIHADETGWREDGQNGYVWAFVRDGAQALRYCAYHHSRGRYIPQGILGLHFAGHLVSDFYGAYNVIRGPHQRCWVHLLRDLHTLRETYPTQEAVQHWAQALSALYIQSQDWLAAHASASDPERAAYYDNLLARAVILGQQYARQTKHPCRALAQRLLRHQDELFQFVRYPGVPADNNLAERSLRPLVIMRKSCGGTRSPEGSTTRMALFSLFSTWAARGLNPFRHCLALLQSANAPPPFSLP